MSDLGSGGELTAVKGPGGLSGDGEDEGAVGDDETTTASVQFDENDRRRKNPKNLIATALGFNG